MGLQLAPTARNFPPQLWQKLVLIINAKHKFLDFIFIFPFPDERKGSEE
jgi:hypothetical protein